MCGRPANSSSNLSLKGSHIEQVHEHRHLGVITGEGGKADFLASSIHFAFAGCKIMALSLHNQMLHLCFSVVPYEQCIFIRCIQRRVICKHMLQFTLSLVICKGRSLIKIQNRSGPKIDPQRMFSLEYLP